MVTKVPENMLVPAGLQHLSYGTSVATDLAEGNVCVLEVTDGVGFTLANPTNMQVGEILTYEIVNASGGSMGTLTWGANFVYRDSSWSNPANGKRRSISFRYRGSNSWLQLGPASGDM